MATTKKPGLWANINARRDAGKPKKKPGQPGYPTAKALRASKGK